nr:hypothetical protein [Serratia plymuthica]
MKSTMLIIFSLLVSFSANAGRMTMSGPEQEELQGGKLLCVYENSIYLFTLVTRSQVYPYSKTFDTSKNKK